MEVEELYKKYGKENPTTSMGFLEKVKKVLTSPTEFFEKVKGEEGIGEAFKYYIIFSLIYNIIFGLLVNFGLSGIPIEQMGPFRALGLALPIAFFIISLISLFIGTAILHAFAKIFGGKGDYSETFKAVVYGATPSLLLGWVPFIGLILVFYSLYLQIKGISMLHQVSMGRAFLIVFLIPIIIGIIIGVLAIIFGLAISGPERWIGPPTGQFLSILRIFI